MQQPHMQQTPMQQTPIQQPQMQQQFIGQQPGVTVLTQNAPPVDTDKFSPSSLSQMRGLSVAQIIMGCLCLLFGIVLVVLQSAHRYGGSGGPAYVGYGIWTGIYFIIVGGIGLGAVRSNTNCWIVSAMILNIICAAGFWVTLVSLSSTGLALTTLKGCDYDEYYFGGYNSFYCPGENVDKVFLALDSLMLIMAFVELIVSIWSAVLCCGAICRCCKTQQTGRVIQYNATPAVQPHQVVMYPSAPATASYPVYAQGQQFIVQGQNTAYPTGAYPQQAAGYVAQSHAPPSYSAVAQNMAPQDPGYVQPPPAAPEATPQQPNKHQGY